MEKVKKYIVETLGITDIFHYAAAEEKYFELELEATSYERRTTFYSDFSIAEVYGIDAIQETYDNAIKEWISDIEYITEFAMVLNYKSWEWSYRGDEFDDLVRFYAKLFYDAQERIYKYYKHDDKSLNYYYSTTD